MPHTTHYTQSALDAMIGWDEATEKHYCSTCSKLYKNQGPLKNHIKSDHSEKLQEIVNSLAEKHDLNKIVYHHKYIFDSVERKIERLTNDIAQLDGYREKYGFNYFFETYAHQMFVTTEELNLVKEIWGVMTFSEHQIYLDEMITELESLKEKWTSDITSGFPFHNSTSELSNVANRYKAEAKVNLIKSDWSKGLLVEIINMMKRLDEDSQKL